MKKGDIWLAPLCVLIVLVNVTDSIFARIALGLNAIVVLINIILKVRSWRKGREKSI